MDALTFHACHSYLTLPQARHIIMYHALSPARCVGATALLAMA